jgi:FHA domain-containing protein
MSDTSAPILAALISAPIAASAVIFQVIYNARATRRAEQNKADEEQKLRRHELALKIIEAIKNDPEHGPTRFAIGLVKVEAVGNWQWSKESNDKALFDLIKTDERGKVYFIPINTRISVGRHPTNDIRLVDPNLSHEDNLVMSRHQSGFVSDEDNVFVEDFHSANGTFVLDPQGTITLELEGDVSELELKSRVMKFTQVPKARRLFDNDIIWIGPFLLRYVKLEENTNLILRPTQQKSRWARWLL